MKVVTSSNCFLNLLDSANINAWNSLGDIRNTSIWHNCMRSPRDFIQQSSNHHIQLCQCGGCSCPLGCAVLVTILNNLNIPNSMVTTVVDPFVYAPLWVLILSFSHIFFFFFWKTSCIRSRQPLQRGCPPPYHYYDLLEDFSCNRTNYHTCSGADPGIPWCGGEMRNGKSHRKIVATVTVVVIATGIMTATA